MLLRGVLVSNAQELTTYVNDSLCQMLGYTKEEILGKPISDLIVQEDLEDHRKKMKNRVKGNAETYERRFRKKDGMTAWMFVSAKPILDENGAYAGSFGHLSDITQKKLEERNLHLLLKTQTELAQVTSIDEAYKLMGSRIKEIIPEGIVGTTSMDEEKGLIKIKYLFGMENLSNELMEEFKFDPRSIQYPLKNAPFIELMTLNSSRLQVFAGDLYLLLSKKIPKTVCKALERRMEINHIYMMGMIAESRYFGGVVIMSKFDLSSFAEVIESLVNQTSLVIKHLQADLDKEQSQERLLVTFNAIEDGYWDWDVPTGQITVNDKWYTMLGYKPGEFPSDYENFLKLLHPDDLDITNQEIKKATEASDKKFNMEFRLLTKSGDYKHINSRGKLIGFSPAGDPTRMVGTHIDITDRKNLEKKREVFYETQRKLLQVSNLEELYALTGNCLIRLLPDGYVVFTRFDDENQVIKIAGFTGSEKPWTNCLRIMV